MSKVKNISKLRPAKANESIEEIAARLYIYPEVAAVAVRLNPVEQLELASNLDGYAIQLRRLAWAAMEDLPELEALVERLKGHNPAKVHEFAQRLAKMAEVAAMYCESREAKIIPLAARMMNGVGGEGN